MPTFFSYAHEDSELVDVVRLFSESSLDKVFTYKNSQTAVLDIVPANNRELARSENLVVFVGERVGKYQAHEVNQFMRWIQDEDRVQTGTEPCERRAVVVQLCTDMHFAAHLSATGSLSAVGGLQRICETTTNRPDEVIALRIATRIAGVLGVLWKSFDDLPNNPHLFSYEKDIIRYFHEVQRLFPDFQIDAAKVKAKPDCSPQDADLAETIERKWLEGCPVKWPDVTRLGPPFHENLLAADEIGRRRTPEARVVVKALTEGDLVGSVEYSFPEAGPRMNLYYPVKHSRTLHVGIVVSGGIAPGVNAVIDGIVQRHWKYAKRHNYEAGLKIFGLQDGFLSFNHFDSYVMLAANEAHAAQAVPGSKVIYTANRAHEGGSILGTSRVDGLLSSSERAKTLLANDNHLMKLGIDILYVIGGDGTMKAAHALHQVSRQNAQRNGRFLSVVAIPKTMDNDILWVWQSFGFLSAVEKAREVIEHLSTEVQSNPRFCVVQLFGSDSGFVVSHAVLAGATGHCVAALIPEVRFSMEGLISYLQSRITITDHRPPHGIVVMAETAIPTDAMKYVNAEPPKEGEAPSPYYIGLSQDEKDQIIEFEKMRLLDKRIQGQTNDFLRSAGLKIVSRGLANMLAKDADGSAVEGWELLRVFTNEPRHLLRAIPPSCLDIIVGQRLGTLAVDNVLAGYTDFMVSQWLTEYVLVPLKLAVLGRKRIPQPGMFWKSVLAKTGQPADLEHVTRNVSVQLA